MTRKILPGIRPTQRPAKKVLPDISRNQSAQKVYVPRNDRVPGWVYMVEDLEGDIKVGLSRNVKRRHSELQSDYGNLKPLGKVWVFEMKTVEDILLDRYTYINIHKADHLSGSTEWHRCNKMTALEMVFNLYWQGLAFNVGYCCRWVKLNKYWLMALLTLFLVAVFK